MIRKLVLAATLGVATLMVAPAMAMDCKDVAPADILRMANRSPEMFKEDAQAIAVLDERSHYLGPGNPVGHLCSAIISTTFENGILHYNTKLEVPGIGSHHDRMEYSFEFYFPLYHLPCRGNLEAGTGPVCTNEEVMWQGDLEDETPQAGPFSNARKPSVASRTRPDHCAGLAPADLAIVQTFGLSCTDKR